MPLPGYSRARNADGQPDGVRFLKHAACDSSGSRRARVWFFEYHSHLVCAGNTARVFAGDPRGPEVMQRNLEKRGKVLTEIRVSTRGGSNRSAKNPCRRDGPRALCREGGLVGAGLACDIKLPRLREPATGAQCLERTFQAARRQKTPRFRGRGSRTVAAAGEETWAEAGAAGSGPHPGIRRRIPQVRDDRTELLMVYSIRSSLCYGPWAGGGGFVTAVRLLGRRL